MNSWVIADSGLFIATVLPETLTTVAIRKTQEWIDRGIEFAAPLLFQYEVIAVMRKQVHRNYLTPAEGIAKAQLILDYPIEYFMDGDLLRKAYEISGMLNQPTAYDSQYLALAERLGCEFWTTDERLYNATRSSLRYIRWLGTLPP
jgi:predicted nucleic acid-binding protein